MVRDKVVGDAVVECSWAPCIPKETVTFGDKNDETQWDEHGGIKQILPEEHFIHIMKPESDKPCTLRIQFSEPDIQITDLSIVSESHIFEIYGKYGEYIKTCQCELLTEANDLKFFGCQPDLLTAEEITIKFPSMKKDFWLFGIKVLVNRTQRSKGGSFDFNLVDYRLKSSGVPITEKAEKLKKFLQEYAGARCPSSDPHLMYKFMEAECMAHLKPVGETGRNISNYLTSLLPSSMNQEDAGEVNGSGKTEANGTNTPSLNYATHEQNVNFENYVDENLHKLEEKLEQSFHRKLQELETRQNEKLDAILALLKNSALS